MYRRRRQGLRHPGIERHLVQLMQALPVRRSLQGHLPFHLLQARRRLVKPLLVVLVVRIMDHRDLLVCLNPTPITGTPASGRVLGLRRDPYAQLSILERAILLQILNAPPSEKGVNVRTITRGISHHNATQAKIS